MSTRQLHGALLATESLHQTVTSGIETYIYPVVAFLFLQSYILSIIGTDLSRRAQASSVPDNDIVIREGHAFKGFMVINTIVLAITIIVMVVKYRKTIHEISSIPKIK